MAWTKWIYYNNQKDKIGYPIPLLNQKRPPKWDILQYSEDKISTKYKKTIKLLRLSFALSFNQNKIFQEKRTLSTNQWRAQFFPAKP